MITTKAEKQGNAIIIAVPRSLGIKEGEEFFVVKKDNGIITLIPKLEDPFEYVENGKFHTPDKNADYLPLKREIDDE